MEPAEELFLRLISSFRIEDIRHAITADLDLAQITREELPEYVEGFKLSAEQYRRAHPDRERALRKDPQEAARKVINWLKTWRPDLGYEIEAYKRYPTIESAGFVPKASVASAVQFAPSAVDVHVGYRWVAKNLDSFLRLFA